MDITFTLCNITLIQRRISPLSKKKQSLFFKAILILLFTASSKLAYCQSLIEQGNNEFINKNYGEALAFYRDHLRANPQDYDVWSLLGASYYHVGSAKKAIKALRKSKSKTANASQNLYYLGLSYDSLKQPNRARKYLTLASEIQDPFGALAIIELAGLEYDARNFKKAKYWAKQYLKRFRRGNYHEAVNELLKNINKGQYIPLDYTQRNQTKNSNYQNHRLSLFDKPHFWLFQTGFDYSAGTRSNPAIDNNGTPIVETGAGFEETSINLVAGLGYGPIQNNDTTINIGYYYKQNWFTNSERVSVYFEDITDFSYFPYRPDLQQRSHKFFGEVSTAITEKLDLGLYSHLDFVKSGSSLYPAPERPEIRQSINISQNATMTPWLKYQFNTKNSMTLYLQLIKNIDLDQSEFSFQTYSFFSTKNPFFSFGIAHEGLYLLKKLKLYSELYKYRFLTNDYWEEYERTGILIKLQYRMSQKWHLMVKGSSYQDNYLFSQIKSGSCDFNNNAAIDSTGVTCPRSDEGVWIQGGVTVAPGPHDSWSFYGGIKNHSNGQLKVYDEVRYEFYFQYSLAFPSPEKSSKYLNYYAGSLNRREVL